MVDSTSMDTPSADDVLRDAVAPFLVVPEFEPAFTMPKPLRDAKVAIVTTAGLMRHGEEAWGHDDADFRVFDASEQDVMAGHVSISLDRVGMVLDRNVYYPIDRLSEMAAEGVIGELAARHISFMGGLRGPNELSTVIMDSGPRAAKILRDDGVDVVLIAPVCPACSRTVLVLGHVLEQQGLSTIALASNIDIARHAKTPRALFCDFPIGWPFGPPKNKDCQRRVLDAAFRLLERPSGPVLEVFPDIIKSDAATPMSCTMPPRYDPDLPEPIDEAKGLRSAWERAYRENGVSNVGRRLTVDDIPDAIAAFIAISDGVHWQSAFSSKDHLVESAADIKHYYEEAGTALIDYVPAARAGEAWFYQKTKTGALFKRVSAVLQSSGQVKELGLMALQYIVPLSQSEATHMDKSLLLRLVEWGPINRLYRKIFAWALKRKMKQHEARATSRQS